MIKNIFRILFACSVIGSGLISLGGRGLDPLIFGVADLTQLVSEEQMALVFSALLLYDFVLSGILVVFVLKNRLSLIHFAIVILLMVSNVMQGGIALNMINGIISSLCLWVSYWLFFDMFFEKESKMQKFFAISERDQIFSVFKLKNKSLERQSSSLLFFAIISLTRST